MQTKLKPEPGPTTEQIQRRAYELWEKGGRQPGRELDDWLQAEAELRRAASPNGDESARTRPNRRSKAFGVEGTRRPVL